MRSRFDQVSGKSVRTGQLLLFFGLYFFLLWKVVDLRVVYHGGGLLGNIPVFYWGREFLKECLPQPAGILDYVRALLFQTFYSSSLGALTVTGLAWAAYGSARLYLSAIKARDISLGALLPAVCLLGAFSKHIYSVVAMSTQCCVVMAGLLAVAYGTLLPRGPLIRATLAISCATALLFTFPGAFLAFVLLVVLMEWDQQGRWFILAGLLFAGICLPPAVSVWGYDLSAKEGYSAIAPFSLSHRLLRNSGLLWLWGAYFGLPALAVVARVREGLNRVRADTRAVAAAGAQITPQSGVEPEKNRAMTGWIRLATETVALLVLACGACLFSISKETRALLQVDYHAYQREWKEVLAAARDDTNSIHIQCAVNQALFHLGRLGDDLNLWQNPEGLLLYDHKLRPDWNVIDVYLDLGFVEMAHHYLVEAVDIYGERPALLRRLVLVNTVLGNVGTAKIYLTALTKVPFHSAWARSYLAQMTKDPSMSQDKAVTRLRGLMMTRDQVAPLPIDELMLSLLEANPRNRMAFEYLMAYNLMTRNLKGFASQLFRLEQFSMGELPRYYQEAIVLAVESLGLNLGAASARVGNAAAERFRGFVQARQELKLNPSKSPRELQRDFGDSYYFYYFSR